MSILVIFRKRPIFPLGVLVAAARVARVARVLLLLPLLLTRSEKNGKGKKGEEGKGRPPAYNKCPRVSSKSRQQGK